MDVINLFDSAKVKMAKIAECYSEMSEGFEFAKRFESVGFKEDKSQDSDNRLNVMYKYMATVFSEWASSLKLGANHFQYHLAPINDKSLKDFQGLYDVACFHAAPQEAGRAGQRADRRAQKVQRRRRARHLQRHVQEEERIAQLEREDCIRRHREARDPAVQLDDKDPRHVLQAMPREHEVRAEGVLEGLRSLPQGRRESSLILTQLMDSFCDFIKVTNIHMVDMKQGEVCVNPADHKQPAD